MSQIKYCSKMLFICKIAWVLVNIYLFTSCPVWDIFCLIYMKIYINSGGSLKEHPAVTNSYLNTVFHPGNQNGEGKFL